MNYRQLQIALKELRAQGITVFCKLNDRKDVLQAEYNRLQYTSPWDNQDDVDFDDDTDCILNSDTVDGWGECIETLPSDVFYTDTDLDSIEGEPSIDYDSPSLLDSVEDESDSQSANLELELEISKLDAYIQTEVYMQLANINYVTIDSDRIGYWKRCTWHVVDLTNYPDISLKTEVVTGNATLIAEETLELSTLITRIQQS